MSETGREALARRQLVREGVDWLRDVLRSPQGVESPVPVTLAVLEHLLDAEHVVRCLRVDHGSGSIEARLRAAARDPVKDEAAQRVCRAIDWMDER